MKRWAPVMVFILILCLPKGAWAHASLVSSNPPPNAHMTRAPDEVRLTFNERIEDRFYFIKVFDQKGAEVSRGKTQLSRDHTTLRVKLPKLPDGVYTVSYRVISADGHPVAASYLVTVGKAREETAAAPSGHPHDGSLQRIVFYGLYYLTLLALAGWTGLMRLFPDTLSFARKNWYRTLSRFFLLICALTGVSELYDGVGGFHFGVWPAFLLETDAGRLVLLRLLLAAAGVFLLGKNRWADLSWTLAILLVEAVSGHAAAFHPQALTISLDYVHLLAASFWAGGLAVAALHWKRAKQRIFAEFLPVFSTGAFISLVVLIVSGLVSTVFYLPDPSEILASEWGIDLLIKMGLVVLVVIVAAFLRRAMAKRAPEGAAKWLIADFVLMAAITFVVGALTYSNPFPTNQPLDWKAKADGFQAETTITPNMPGTANTVRLSVTSANHALQDVQLVLEDKGDPEVAPLTIPLKKQDVKRVKGKTVTVYEATGQFFLNPGRYRLNLYLVDDRDNESVVTREMKLYDVLTP
jgi:copper transport protein